MAEPNTNSIETVTRIIMVGSLTAAAFSINLSPPTRLPCALVGETLKVLSD